MSDLEREIISDAELEQAAGNANFGSASKRDVIAYALLKTACGYSTGHTARCMLEDLRLVGKTQNPRAVPGLVKKGRLYLWACFGRKSF